MKAMRKMKYNAFTLIELVIVVAIIGILALMVIPRFSKATENAKVQIFNGNCKTILTGIGAWQAAHDGDMPADEKELGSLIDGGWAGVTAGPTGASYNYENGIFEASYTDSEGTTHSFRYPKQ